MSSIINLSNAPKHWCVVCNHRIHKTVLGAIIILLGIVFTGIIPESIIGVSLLVIGAFIVLIDVLEQSIGPKKEWRLIFVEKMDDPMDFINDEFDLQV